MKDEISNLRKVNKSDDAWWSEGQVSNKLAEQILAVLESTKPEEKALVKECQVSYMGSDNISYMILMFEVKSGPGKFFDFLEAKLEGK